LVILLPPPFKLFLRPVEPPEFFVPLGLQDVGHKTVAWVDLHETTPGEIGLLSSPLYGLAPQGIGLVYPHIEFGLDSHGNLQRYWCDHLNEQLSDALVDAGSRDRLALAGGFVDALSLTDVFRALFAFARVITDSHSSSA